jgi:cobyrinic acid a,c-diamide synthase
MYLSRAITLGNGKRYPMAGILPSETRMAGCRKRLGYVEVEFRESTLWGKAGDRLRGHEFHYSELVSHPVSRKGWSAAYRLTTRNGVSLHPEGFYHRSGRVLASYVHLHLAGHPAALDWFLAECVRARETRLP